MLLYEKVPLVAQLVKNPQQKRETWFSPLVGKIPLRRERLPTPVFWPREFHGLYSSWGHKELDTTERSFHFHYPYEKVIIKWNNARAGYILYIQHMAYIRSVFEMIGVVDKVDEKGPFELENAFGKGRHVWDNITEFWVAKGGVMSRRQVGNGYRTEMGGYRNLYLFTCYLVL